MAKATEAQKRKVARVMGEFKRGELYSSSGDLVTNRNQAIAIAMSEARLSYDSNPRKGRAMAKKKGRKKASKKTAKKFSKSAYKKAVAAGASRPMALQVGWGRMSIAEAKRKSAGAAKPKRKKTSRKKTGKKRAKASKKTAKKRVTKKAKKHGKRVSKDTAQDYAIKELTKEVKRLRAGKVDKRKTPKKTTKRKKAAAPKAAKKTGRKKTARRRKPPTLAKAGPAKVTVIPSVRAEQILTGRTAGQLKLWVCGGHKRTGCGGGSRLGTGSRVMGHIR